MKNESDFDEQKCEDEEHIQYMLERKAHEEYLNNLKDKYNTALYKFFLETEEFHDLYILDINYSADTNKWRKSKTDTIVIELEEDLQKHRYFKIEFSDITRFSLDSHGKKLSEVWSVIIGDFDADDQIRSAIGEIFQSEIGIDEYGNNYIRLVTSEGYVLYIGFKKFRVLNKKHY